MKNNNVFLFRIKDINIIEDMPENHQPAPPADSRFPKSVETRLPPKSAFTVIKKNDMMLAFESMTLEEIRRIPLFIERNKDRPKNKSLLIEYLINFFTSTTLEQFDSWLTNFSPLSQELLRDAALFGCVVLEKYEAKYGGPLTPKKDYYSWNIKLEPSLKLDFFWTTKVINQPVAGLPWALRDALKPWFAGPAESEIAGCAVAAPDTSVIVNNAGVIYNNALEISGSFPLLCDSLLPLAIQFANGDTSASLKSFTKKQLAALQAQCGFKPFPEVCEKAPDALDITARAVLCITNLKPARPEDGQDGVKKLVDDFFGAGVQNTGKTYTSSSSYKWDFIENYVLTAHLRKKSVDWGYYQKPPPSRNIFQKILEAIAKDGRWFSVSRLARYILINEDNFAFTHKRGEDRIYIRAASIVFDGISYQSSYGENDFWPHIAFRYDLLIRPLLSAYCYLFAALGLLEITQSPPAQPVTSGSNKTRAISPYDALDAVRITDFGRWCLGLITERPGRIQEDYEAIADKELLLVTVRGSSFERTLFLDSIGEKLGEDRWRISPRSFIADCADQKDIEARITKFKRLIDKNPAPHWETLFSRSLERAGLFNKNIVPAVVYHLGNNRALIEELLADPALAGCAFRAEGGMLVVPEKHKRKFFDFLAAHGVVYT